MAHHEAAFDADAAVEGISRPDVKGGGRRETAASTEQAKRPLSGIAGTEIRIRRSQIRSTQDPSARINFDAPGAWLIGGLRKHTLAQQTK
jgi:hypothetical protein